MRYGTWWTRLGAALALGAVLAGTGSAQAQRAEPGDAGADALPLREEALRAPGLRLVVSLEERRVRLMDGPRTLHSAPVAVGRGTVLRDGGRLWDFSTPRGRRVVLGKEENPVWVPPDWHYVELAREKGLTLLRLRRGRGVPLRDGSRVVVRGERIGRVSADGRFEPVPPDEEVLYGDTLFIPPFDTANRRIRGELGRYKLDLGEGYLLHGTPHHDSVGTAATHGCMRLLDEDIAYLYAHVPVGTPVYVY